MPFDSLTLAPSETLQTAASEAGLAIVDLGLLERHKAAELKRHEPGWAYRHRATLQIGFGIAVVAGFVGFLLLNSQGFTAPALAMVVALCGLIAFALTMPIRAPARWEERVEADLASVPPCIARSARTLREKFPEVEFRVGELFQREIKLDPYLVAGHDDARLLLGIWDGDKVIFCA